MKVFSGTSNLPLAQKVARQLDVLLGNVEITRFIDNECRVYIKEEVEGQDVVVIQSLSSIADQHLVELCLMGQALKDLKAKRVIAVIPWMGYSKQDKAFRKGEAISSQLVAKFIEAAGFDAVISCELHSENVMPYFHIPLVELSTHTLLADTLQMKSRPGLKDIVVVSPDKGGKSRSERFAKAVGLPILYMDKVRDVGTGEVTVTNVSGDVDGKSVIIFDDIINTGATAIKTSEFLKAKGVAQIYFLATHAVLAGEAVRFLSESAITQVIVTDSIKVEGEKQFATLTITSVAPVLASAITQYLR